MGRLRPAPLVVLVGLSAVLMAPPASFAGPGGTTRGQAASSGKQAAPGVTFTLQKPTTCKAPATVRGDACVDATGMVEPPPYKWQVGNGTAKRDTNLYETSFSWTVPPKIPGDVKLAIKAKGLEGNRVCPAISVSGAFGSGQIYKCAESGTTLDENLTVKLKPFNATAGTPWSLTVSVLDGPDYTYTYRAGAAAAPKAGTATNRIASITSSPCYSVFLGLKDRSPTDEPFSPWRTEMGIKVARTAIDYPGVTIEAAIPGEGDSGVHSPAMLVPGNDLFTLLARSEPPTELFQSGNVYARVTPRFEVALRRKILASRGDLMPADVLRLALDAVKEVSGTASYPLAVLTAHNLLKNATMIGRAAIQDANALHLPKNPSSQLIALHNSKVAKEEQTLCKWSPIVAKLASLRLNPAASKDKMGPWYHGFGILSAGALLNGEKARLAMFAEHAGKSLKLFSKEGGFNAEKFALDKEFAATAVHISNEGLRRF